MSRFLTRFQIGFWTSLWLMFSVNDLWASGGGGGVRGELFWQIVSFVLLVALLSYALKKPLRSSLAKRREDVKSSLDQAAQQEKKSKSHFTDWEKKLNSLSQEIADIHQKISAEGEAERQKIVERAREEGERIKKQAEVASEQEVKKARAALKKEMVDLSVELAEMLLKEKAEPQDQERLVRDYITKVRELR